MNQGDRSTGNRVALSDRTAGGLAYITAIPAVYFLLAHPYNKRPFIRFHAWQAIYLLIACVVISIVLGLVTNHVPFLGFLQFDHFPLVSLVMVVVWIVVLMKAFNGERYRLPIIGHLADRRVEPYPQFKD